MVTQVRTVHRASTAVDFIQQQVPYKNQSPKSDGFLVPPFPLEGNDYFRRVSAVAGKFPIPLKLLYF